MKKKRKKIKTQETGAAQMAAPSGPAYDTTGNQRLESKYVNVGEWGQLIEENVNILFKKALIESKIKRSDSNDLKNLKKLAGIKENASAPTLDNMSHTANEKARIMKEKNIKPGTPEWFKLWFSLPYWFKEGPNR
jgi:hypothetical protein